MGQGNLECAMDLIFVKILNAPKVMTEGVQNLIDFKQEKGGGYTCKCCGYYAHKKYCGCLKVTEYDKDAGLLTIYHQGKHICTAKPLCYFKEEIC